MAMANIEIEINPRSPLASEMALLFVVLAQPIDRFAPDLYWRLWGRVFDWCYVITMPGGR